MLEAIAAFVAAKKLVWETNVAAHAANGLKIHHCFSFRCALRSKEEGKEANLEGGRERPESQRAHTN